MKRVNILSLFAVIMLLLLTACGTEQVAPCEDPTALIEVDFSWTPENPQESEKVILKAHVTQNGLDVSNAEDMQDIQFEIWEHNNPDYHHMVEAKHEGDGVYTLDWTFDKEGVYYAYYHVTACYMHRMEKEMLVVGSPDVEAITAEEDTVQSHMSDGYEGMEENHDEHEESAIH